MARHYAWKVVYPSPNQWMGVGGGISSKFCGRVNIFQLYVEKVNMSTVDRGFLTPLFYEDPPPSPPPFLFTPPFFKSFQPTPTSWFLCHVSLAWCVIVPHLVRVIFLNDTADLHLSSRCTLVPEVSCYVFYATRCQV